MVSDQSPSLLNHIIILTVLYEIPLPSLILPLLTLWNTQMYSIKWKNPSFNLHFNIIGAAKMIWKMKYQLIIVCYVCLKYKRIYVKIYMSLQSSISILSVQDACLILYNEVGKNYCELKSIIFIWKTTELKYTHLYLMNSTYLIFNIVRHCTWWNIRVTISKQWISN